MASTLVNFREAPAGVKPPLELETARLRLRQWRAGDRASFAAMNAAPPVMAHFPALLTADASNALADKIQARIAERGWGFWAVEEKTSGAFIGFIGLNQPAALLPFTFTPCVEIGWRLAHRYWGRGFATEGAEAALAAAFARLELSEVVAFTSIGNLRSRAVMERLGMREAPTTFDHPDLPVGSPLREHCLYRLTREAWQARNLLTEDKELQ